MLLVGFGKASVFPCNSKLVEIGRTAVLAAVALIATVLLLLLTLMCSVAAAVVSCC